MAKATQENRLLSIETPLGKDYLLINKLSVTESISGLYEMEVELLYDEELDDARDITQIDIQQILGQTVNITIDQKDDAARQYIGMVNRFRQIDRRQRFSYYSARVVPNVWRLTQNTQSRIFQRKSVPDILAEVFDGFQVNFQFKKTYKPRDYCVQYNESDFDFAARLMAEEGVFFYFDHSGEMEKMVVRDDYTTPENCPNKHEVPMYDMDLHQGEGWQGSINSLIIDYKLESGTQTFWDYNLQLPGKKLDATIASRNKIGGNQSMETYLYPGGYAKRYDGIDSSGGDKTSNLDTIFSDNKKAVENQMLAVDSRHKILSGVSDCASLTAGYRFNLERHANSEMNISYVVVSVSHTVSQTPAFENDRDVPDHYKNEFKCIPHGSGYPEFRLYSDLPKPVIQGSQTAFVVGPEGEEILVDKFGRIKVQFHWDRQGQLDANSSCWVPVSQGWAGNKWGMVFIPRIGMEVIVDFLDGDPDRPIVKGCVYNPGAMPPYDLPAEKTKSTIKSDSSPDKDGFNEFRIEDKKDKEQIFIHGEKDVDVRNKNDRREYIGNDQHYIVENDRRDHVKRDEHLTVDRHKYQEIKEERHTTIGGEENVDIGGSYSLKVVDGIEVQSSSHSHEASGAITLKAGSSIVLDCPGGVTLKSGGSFVSVTSAGVDIVGGMVKLNSGGSGGSGTAPSIVAPTQPEEPAVADDAQPGTIIELQKQSANLKEKTHKEGNEEKKSWVKIKLVDEEGNPVSGMSFKCTTPDGRVASGSTDKDGKAEVKNIDPGNCQITFPKLDKEAWEEG